MIDGKKVVATIEARMTSTRLPGKVMIPLAGKPVVAHMIERHRRSRYTDEVVVATTVNATDDPVVALCEEMKCAYYRGSEADVLGRVVEAGIAHSADILVQGMADSPLVDWRTIDRLVAMLEEGGFDAVSNEFEKEKYPDGFDMRVYRFSVLKKFEEEHKEEVYREHAGYQLRNDPVHYKRGLLLAKGDAFWQTLRLTLDTIEDYKLISAIFDEMYTKNPDFSSEDVVAFLKTRPDLVAINAEIVQKVPAV
ncbi:MAG: glycosyltransferase family protein [bacterium]|nr:glycosyltransferase family protein [bacterium]